MTIRTNSLKSRSPNVLRKLLNNDVCSDDNKHKRFYDETTAGDTFKDGRFKIHCFSTGI